ncbi:MAG: hypothetical protein IPI17_17975 [Nitrosomonas sp.]|nr:hypothetical protein [Nitrosomonas sp.]
MQFQAHHRQRWSITLTASRDITLTWTYTDGAVPADGFILFYREGTGTVLSTDAGIQLPATASSFRFQGVHQGTAYRADIAAFRRTEAGLRITSIYQPTSAPDWRVSATTVNITANINGVGASTLTSQASAGSAIQQALEANGSVILTGQLVPTNTGAIKAGTITWNSTTGALTGGTGIAVTKWGIIGANAGTATFTIETSTGTATLKGNISGGSNIDITGTAIFTVNQPIRRVWGNVCCWGKWFTGRKCGDCWIWKQALDTGVHGTMRHLAGGVRGISRYRGHWGGC